MLAATTLAVLFMLALLPAMQGAFSLALQDSIEQRLASDVTTLISAARVENGRLVMPSQLPDERFNLTDFRLLGYIYDREGQTGVALESHPGRADQLQTALRRARQRVRADS